MANEIKLDYIGTTEGYGIFHGPEKVGVLSCMHHQGLYREGRVVMEVLPKEYWTIRFVTPYQTLDMLKAIADSMPTEPPYKSI